MIRNQFTFYRSYYEALQPLPKETQATILLAVCAYALYEAEPDGLDPTESAAFNLIRPTLDTARRKAQNGKQGGEANRKQNGSKTEANEKQTGSKKEREKEREGEKEEEIEKEKEKESYNPLSPFSSRSLSQELGRAWNEILNNYPQDHIGDQRAAEMAYKKAIKSPEEADQMLRNLGQWLQTEQWTKESGRYIPQLANWIGRGTWAANPPRPAIPQGASGELGLAEMYSLWQTMGYPLEEREALAEKWKKEHPGRECY